MGELQEFELRGFWANKYPEWNKAFTKGHQDVLYDHGLGFFTSNEEYWHGFDNVYVAIVIHDGEVVAGLRLETKIPERLLPLEKALKSKDNKVSEWVNGLNCEKIFEVCGLWNSKSYAGYDFVTYLCRACLAISPYLGFNCALSLNGFYTYRIPKDIGCTMVSSLGNKGKFAYPVERFHSAIWLQDDLIDMKLASDDCKQLVNELRPTFKASRIEKNKRVETKMTYDLEL